MSRMKKVSNGQKIGEGSRRDWGKSSQPRTAKCERRVVENMKVHAREHAERL